MSVFRTGPERGLEYQEIDISRDPSPQVEMVERSGRRTVPRIFVDDAPIGGFDEPSESIRAGKLNPSPFFNAISQ